MTPELSHLLLGTGTVLALITAIGAQNAFVLRQALLGRFIVPVIVFCTVADALLYALGVGGMGFLVQRLPWVITALRWGGVAFLVGYGLMAAHRALRPTGEALVVTEADAIGPDAVLPAAQTEATASASQTAPETAGHGAPLRAGTGSATTTATLPRVASPATQGPTSGADPRTSTGGRGRGGLAAVLLTCAAMTFLNPHTYLDTVVLVGSVANQQGAEGKWWFWVGATLGSAIWFLALGFGARLLRPLFARAITWRVLDAGIAVLMWSIAWHLLRG